MDLFDKSINLFSFELVYYPISKWQAPDFSMTRVAWRNNCKNLLIKENGF